MKRPLSNPYSDGPYGNYDGKCRKIATEGVFRNTRGASRQSINASIGTDELLNIFRHCDYLAFLSTTRRVCQNWNKIICNPANQQGILYRTAQTSYVDFHCKQGNFRLAQNICERTDKDVEYFQNLNDEIIDQIRNSKTLHHTFLNSIKKEHTYCIPNIERILNGAEPNPLQLVALQEHIHVISENMLSFMQRSETHFQRGYPIVIANIFQKLIPAFQVTGKINLATNFQRFLNNLNKTFIRLVNQEFTHYLDVLKTLCTDLSLHVKEEAIVSLGLMATHFSRHKHTPWIPFLDILKESVELTKHIIKIIESSPEASKSHFPNQISLLITINDFFIPFFQENSSKFISFLEDVFLSKLPSTKASSAITLLIIAFDERLTKNHDKMLRLSYFRLEFEKDLDLLDNILKQAKFMKFHSLLANLENSFPDLIKN